MFNIATGLAGPYVKELNHAIGGVIGPIIHMYNSYAANHSPHITGVAIAFALLFVVIRLIGFYFLIYTLGGIPDLFLHFKKTTRYILSGIVTVSILVLIGFWPKTVYQHLVQEMGYVTSIYTSSSGATVTLSQVVWHLGLGPEVDMAVIVTLALMVTGVLIWKFTRNTYVANRVVIGGVSLIILAFSVLSILHKQVFPIPIKAAFTLDLLAVFGVLYLFTWAMTVIIVQIVSVFEQLHMKEIPGQNISRYKIFTAALLGGIFLASYSTVHAIAVWFGVALYLAGGGMTVLRQIGGDRRKEIEVCEVQEINGSEKQVCQTRTEWQNEGIFSVFNRGDD